MARKKTTRKKSQKKSQKRKVNRRTKPGKPSKPKTSCNPRKSSKPTKFQAPKGTFDILPEDQRYWERVKNVTKQLVSAYGFSIIETPILEDAQLFVKGTGNVTDIVQKEMYTLRTKGGDRLALRPEFTPSIVRAYLEHGMKNRPQPVKLFSLGPVFRHEKPQAGRFRQFHQLNLEIIGDIEAINDVLLIQLIYLIFKKLNIKGVLVHINNIGCPECRPNYRKLLIDYYRKQSRKLCRHCKERLKLNPLRLLDCKEEKCRQLANNAPQAIDYLCEECHSHFKEVLESLDELEIPYILDAHLVRGLDYYTKTVFEFKLEDDNVPELGGGGRYDGLVELLGGKPTPAVGVAIGIERIIMALKRQDAKIPQEAPSKLFLVQLGDLARRKSLSLFEELRSKGLKVTEAFSKNSIKSQLKTADKLNVELALILGQKEALENNIIIRDMKSGTQETVSLNKVVQEVKRRLK